MTDRFILLPSFISEREPSKYRLQAPRARPKCCRTHAHNPAFLPTHIQCVAVTATTTHMIQVRKAIQTLRRKESPSAPRPGISIASNGSLKGACILPALSRTLMRMSFAAPVAAQKKLAKPRSALIRKSALNIWSNGGVVTSATPFRQGPTGCFRRGTLGRSNLRSKKSMGHVPAHYSRYEHRWHEKPPCFKQEHGVCR